MNCKESQDAFTDYLGDELSEARAGEFKQHIKDCSHCRQELVALNKTRGLLQDGWPEEPIPQHLVYEFTKSPSRSVWQRWWPPEPQRFVLASFSVTACFILCIGSLTLFRTQVHFGQGGLQVSFGQSVHQLPQPPMVTPVRSEVSRESLQPLVDLALQQMEQKQDKRLETVLLQLRTEIQDRRDADMRRIANELRQLESAQNVVYRQTVSSNSYLETLARDLYVKANTPAEMVH